MKLLCMALLVMLAALTGWQREGLDPRVALVADEGRTISIKGYAVCTSHMGASVPAPSACSSVRLNTSDGYSDAATPQESVLPNEKGAFTFENVPIPGRGDIKSIHYTITAERGSGTSSDSPGGTCEHSGDIQGITFQFDTLNLFNPIDRGPWTLANQCNPS